MTTKKKKAPTEAQKEAAKLRREGMRKIAKLIGEMPQEVRTTIAIKAGIRTVEGRELSVFNQIFLLKQFEKVSLVGGFNQWRAAGRQVCKGAKALAIFIPIACNRDSQDPEGEDDTRFILGNVFDISQTEEIKSPMPEEAPAE
jgi:hypothetical protein